MGVENALGLFHLSVAQGARVHIVSSKMEEPLVSNI